MEHLLSDISLTVILSSFDFVGPRNKQIRPGVMVFLYFHYVLLITYFYYYFTIFIWHIHRNIFILQALAGKPVSFVNKHWWIVGGKDYWCNVCHLLTTHRQPVFFDELMQNLCTADSRKEMIHSLRFGKDPRS